MAASKGITKGKKEEPRVILSQNNVCVRPGPNQVIPGCLSLIEDGESCILSWKPTTVSAKPAAGSKTDSDELYAIRVPVTEIRSIRRHLPAFGIPYVIIIVQAGVAYPPYYFHDGGVKEFFNTLKMFVQLRRSDDDANLFYVSELTNSTALSSTVLNPIVNSLVRDNLETVQTAVKEASWNILENFSRVTRFARNVKNTLWDLPSAQPPSSLDSVFRSITGGSSIPSAGSPTPPSAAHVASPYSTASKERDSTPYEHKTSLGSFEMLDEDDTKSPRQTSQTVAPPSTSTPALVIAPPGERLAPLTATDWRAMFDEMGRLTNEELVRKRVFYGGIEPALRLEVWPYLLGYVPFNVTHEERANVRRQKREEYNIYLHQWQSITPEQEKHFSKYRSRRHLIEKDVVRTDRSQEFFSGDNNPHLDMLQRILLSYTFFNFDLGYVQGMNDLLAPLLYLMEDEADSFWCFKGFMDRMSPNFQKDQVGMSKQLLQLANLTKLLDPELYSYLEGRECLNMFFCFRWVLIMFKREFPLQDVMRIWEAVWSNYLTPHYHIFIAFAMLQRLKSMILAERMGFDLILKMANETSDRWGPVEPILVEAELAYLKFMAINKEERAGIFDG